jgi:hypothetical protein
MDIIDKPDGRQLISATFKKFGLSDNSFSIIIISADKKQKNTIVLNPDL